MKITSRIVFGVAMALFGSINAFAADPAAVQSLLELSGLPVQVQALPDMVKAEIREHPDMAGDNLRMILAKADAEVLPATIMDKVSAEVAGALSDKQVNALLSWYRSDLGRRITAAEKQGASQQAFQEMTAREDALLANDKRRQAAMRVDKIVSGTDSALALREDTAVAVAGALRQAASPDKPVDKAQLRADFDAHKDEIRAGIEKQVLRNFIYTYRNIDDAGLAQYEEFLKAPAAKAFNAATRTGLNSGMKQAVQQWSSDLAGIFAHPGEASPSSQNAQ